MRQWQHIFPSGFIAAVGIWICWVSYTREPAQAFLFPRLISTVFVVLALWTFGKAALGLSRVGDGIGRRMVINIAPGLAVMLIYVFWAARGLGFYTASTIAFFMLLSIYDPAPHNAARSWIMRILITLGFLAVMYGLFAGILNVFTPREVLFQ
ncbi:tripartite tricarboxylate transporter TctB family protein [Roseovarius halotolerans]|uniref:Tripartite tricarboxylate transporter TctB family protein n=1 Tax=Roseovarius halotolerans TaxID=505353 RepID=A0A1X6YXR8_9RHOB|nr:tripartite tricarboxylate transporter TctB family protein [Roseovarius halotolerans]RKT32706.1 tripartite tricarboxylate transporter TctB family protein [Roseovarius halotolerans]SLN33887.1 Tripartite tricarboxylate transporter TctB family protein [Roseovarius halotolerans]